MPQFETPRPSPALPRRNRIAILAALAGIAALAWIELAWMAVHGMGAGAGSSTRAMLAIHPWSLGDFAMMFAMWAVMMVGMMVPTAMPATLIYAAVARKAQREGEPVGGPAAFVAGYVAVWTLFSVVATVAQWALDQAALLSPMLVATSPALGAGLLVAAGFYQFTPAKDACLAHCRAPAEFLATHMRRGRFGAFRTGGAHGLFCLGCCWALMGLLFVGGVMNLLWIAAITAFVLAEKLSPFARTGGRLAGAAMIAAGAALLAGFVPFPGWGS